MPVYFWYGTILFRYGKIALDPRCCCIRVGCCANNEELVGATLQITFTNVTGCDCLDGVSFDLVWDPVNNYWEGSAGFGPPACSALQETWRLACEGSTEDDFRLTISGGACLVLSGDTPPTQASCEPFSLSFTLSLSGIGCCDSMDGSGTVDAEIIIKP